MPRKQDDLTEASSGTEPAGTEPAGTEPKDGAEGPKTNPEAGEPEEEEEDGKAAKYTDDDVNAIIERRLAREREKWKAEVEKKQQEATEAEKLKGMNLPKIGRASCRERV